MTKKQKAPQDSSSTIESMLSMPISSVLSPPKKKILVITPSVGNEKLRQAIDSVAEQEIDNTKYDILHMIVVDGAQYIDRVGELAYAKTPTKDKLLVQPLFFNTGRVGNANYYGHRIYAGMSHLLPSDTEYVLLLDEDNYYEKDHVHSLVDLLEKNNSYTWTYSLRNIVDDENNRSIHDDCESLGWWPVWPVVKTILDENSGVSTKDMFPVTWKAPGAHLVDTSCYCLRRNLFESVGSAWHNPWGGDRAFFHILKNNTYFGCSGKYTLNYRVGNNTNSVNYEFFEEGNRFMKSVESSIPWSNHESRFENLEKFQQWLNSVSTK